MFLKSKLILFSLFILIMLSACGKKGVSEEKKEEAKKAAVEVTTSWLQLIDNGEYAKSWDNAAEYFKKAAGEEDWSKQMVAVRKPLGKLVERKVASKEYTTSMAGAPDGEYVIVKYQTTFENKESAVETVTAKKSENGTWRVCGYYIK